MAKAATAAPKLAVAAPDNESLLKQMDEQIATVKKARSDLDATYRAQKDQLGMQLRQLETARRDLTRQTKSRRDRGPLDPHKQAGPRNVEAMRKAAKKHPDATQAELSAASGVGTGSTTWAIRALEKEGVLVATNDRRNGSRVYHYKAPKSGSSRVRGPGE